MSKEPPAGVTSLKPVDALHASASFIAVLAMTKSTADVSAETVQSFRPGAPGQEMVAGSDGAISNGVAMLAPLTAKTIQPMRKPETATVILSDDSGVGAIASYSHNLSFGPYDTRRA